MSFIDRLEELFQRRGAEAYLGEPVTISQHMLQCAALAQVDGASEPLVAAALLHDIVPTTRRIAIMTRAGPRCWRAASRCWWSRPCGCM